MPGERPTRTESIFVRPNVLPPPCPAPFSTPSLSLPLFAISLHRSRDSLRSHGARPEYLASSSPWRGCPPSVLPVAGLTLLIAPDRDIESRYATRRTTTITLPGERGGSSCARCAWKNASPRGSDARLKAGRKERSSTTDIVPSLIFFFLTAAEISGVQPARGRVDCKSVRFANQRRSTITRRFFLLYFSSRVLRWTLRGKKKSFDRHSAFSAVYLHFILVAMSSSECCERDVACNGPKCGSIVLFWRRGIGISRIRLKSRRKFAASRILGSRKRVNPENLQYSRPEFHDPIAAHPLINLSEIEAQRKSSDAAVPERT